MKKRNFTRQDEPVEIIGPSKQMNSRAEKNITQQQLFYRGINEKRGIESKKWIPQQN
jgi:hypothetical protein